MLALILALSVMAFPATAEDSAAQTKTLRVIATSDLHGKFLPWDYALNTESRSGSMAQLSTAIAQYRTADTLLVDAGDTIQDNCADIFVGADDAHPMVRALNALNYDVWVTGNHEYNYGMDVVKKPSPTWTPRCWSATCTTRAARPSRPAGTSSMWAACAWR